MLELTRTLLLLLLGLAAILCLIFPPSYFLWQLKIVVSEFSHLLLLVSLVIFCLPFYNRGLWIWPQLILVIEILVLALYPIVCAERIGSNLPKELDLAFGKAAVQREAFSLRGFFAKSPGNSKIETYTYYSSADQQLTLDFYPVKVANAPVVMVIHGGGWDSGDKEQLAGLNHVLVEQGYAVAAINYSLAPRYSSPRPAQDVIKALEFLEQQKYKLNIDANRVVLLGRSAGGQIALQTAYAHLPKQVKGVIAFYSPADMVWGYQFSYYDDILKSKNLMVGYLGGKMEDYPQKYAEASALTHVKKGLPPTLMIHGRKDNLVAFEHNLHLIEKLKPFGIKHYLLDLPWATHGGDYNLNGPTGQLSTYAVLHFLKNTLN